MNLLSIIFLLSCMPSALIDFALPKWKADKNVMIEDAYKWTYQATCGGEHAVPDKESASKWFDREWDTLGIPMENESLWEPLCPGGEIGRLNLRPYKTKGGKSDDLLEAFLTSSRDYRSNGSNFVAAWMELGERLKKKPVGKLDHKAWKKFDAEMRVKDNPAIHHSETYEKTNNPAYRIITAAEMKKLLANPK